MRTFKNINQAELTQILKLKKAIILDVREVAEFKEFNIGGINIPPHEITRRIDELLDYQHLVVACSNGMRSELVARLLLKKLPNCTVFHLEDGVF